MSTAPRGQTHHPWPPADPAALGRFPSRSASGAWFRAHIDRGGPDRGCWWFASVGPDPDDSGRFDLAAPHGTCYFASSEEAAARERVGTQLRQLAGRESVSASALSSPDGPVVVTRAAPEGARAANLPVREAQRWVNRSLAAGTGIYPVAQAWAAAFRAAGFDAVVDEPRFTSGARVRALARFGPAGRPRPVREVVGTVPIGDVLARCGVRVAHAPRTAPAVLAVDATPPPL